MPLLQGALATIVSPPRRAKPWRKWETEERKLLAGMLAALEEQGADLTEVSDARELVGLPRLSEAPPRNPMWVVLWLASDEGQELIALTRALRAQYTFEVLDTDPEYVEAARKMGGIKGKKPEAWRLREIQYVYTQARILAVEGEKP